MKLLKIINPKSYTHTQKILMLFAIALVVVAVLMSVFGYKIGHKQGVRITTAKMLGEVEDGQNQATSIQVASLKQQLDAVVQERDISLSNLDALREQNNSFRTKNLQLKQLNDLLLDNVAKDGGLPLKLLAVEITSHAEDRYEYRMDVAMIDKSGRSVTLYPRLVLLNETAEAKINVKPHEVQGLAYVRGEFVMPKGFKPKQMRVELRVTGGEKEAVRLYNWSVGKAVAVNDERGISERPIGMN